MSIHQLGVGGRGHCIRCLTWPEVETSSASAAQQIQSWAGPAGHRGPRASPADGLVVCGSLRWSNSKVTSCYILMSAATAVAHSYGAMGPGRK